MLASIVERASDAIYSIEADYRISSWNKGAEELFGWQASEVLGQPLALITPMDRVSEAGIWQQVIEAGQQVLNFPTIRVAKDGSTKHVLISAGNIPSLQGTGYAYAAITHDITPQKQAEQQLRELHCRLEQQASELIRANFALESARDEALAASNMKSSFVSNVSHELRTPLSGVLGLAELLLQEPLDEQTRSGVRVIYESALSLLAIINDILDLSKLESGTITLNLKPFSPAAVVEDCFALLSGTARSKSLDFTLSFQTPLPDLVYGDAGRLKQVILNLAGNAIKFTSAGTVTLSAEVIAEGRHQITLMFSVEDSGMGIAPADRAALFSPFSRIERKTRGIIGTGLGLAISKRIIELMGGEINFVSEVTRGSNFWFWIPFGLAPEESKLLSPLVSALSRAPELLSRHRTLIVEDNPVLSELAARQLTVLGAQGDCVFNGRDALAACERRNYDIILLDVHLPDMSGHEVARRLRSARPSVTHDHPVIIAMTAGAMPGDREKALESGMNDYLAKPVDVVKLAETMIKWASRIEAEAHA